MEKHINIPIFIPHEGCPNDCVFCNQRTITGISEKADRDISKEIDTALLTYKGQAENAEIAFFGGSFTGIDRNTMIKLLHTAYSYVLQGKVSSIRLSTRPDYIDTEILDILKVHGVTDIELGIQSMCGHVLDRSKRGHSVQDTQKACNLIKKYGFNLTGQMMIGLPDSTLEDEIYTAKQIAALECDCARIYPTVVFEKTKLCDMAKSGTYSPLSVEDAINRGVQVYEVFAENKIKVLRIGLQATEALVSGIGVYAGANHSALGELIVGEYYFRLIKKILEENLISAYKCQSTLLIQCAPGEQSKVAGQKKINKLRILEEFNAKGINITKIRIIPDLSLCANTVSCSLV